MDIIVCILCHSIFIFTADDSALLDQTDQDTMDEMDNSGANDEMDDTVAIGETDNSAAIGGMDNSAANDESALSDELTTNKQQPKRDLRKRKSRNLQNEDSQKKTRYEETKPPIRKAAVKSNVLGLHPQVRIQQLKEEVKNKVARIAYLEEELSAAKTHQLLAEKKVKELEDMSINVKKRTRQIVYSTK